MHSTSSTGSTASSLTGARRKDTTTHIQQHLAAAAAAAASELWGAIVGCPSHRLCSALMMVVMWPLPPTCVCRRYWHPIVVVGGILQTALYCDFFYYYITAKAKVRRALPAPVDGMHACMLRPKRALPPLPPKPRPQPAADSASAFRSGVGSAMYLQL